MSKALLPALGLGLLLSSSLTAQTRSQPNEPSARTTVSQVEADELFVLDIKERHINEAKFSASTAVEIGPEESKNVRVHVGVALSALSLDVLLRNVTGTVRFRASLQRLVDLVNSHSPR